MPALCCTVALLLFAVVRAAAQKPDSTSARRDTTAKRDTLALARDSLRRADSIAFATGRYDDTGAPLGSTIPTRLRPDDHIISKRDLVRRWYVTAVDAIEPDLSTLRFSLGTPGLADGISVAGASPLDLGTLYNGRPLRNADDEGYDLSLYPVEFMERAEVLTGARAALYGAERSVASVNFTQPFYNVRGSYIRLWYVQAGSTVNGASALYARNIVNNLNLSLGLRNISSDGYYTNQKVSNWNVHGALRFSPSERFTATLTEIFADARAGANGGLDSTSALDPVLALVGNDSLWQETTRHDLTLSTRWYPLGAPPRDTANTTSGEVLRLEGSLYYSHVLENLNAGDHLAVVDEHQHYSRATVYGVRVGGLIPLSFANLQLNSVSEYPIEGSLRFDAGGMLEVPLSKYALLRGTARAFADTAGRRFSLAGEVVVSPVDSLWLRASFRSYGAFPGHAVHVDFPVQYYSDDRTQWLAEGQATWRTGLAMIELHGFIRKSVSWNGSSEQLSAGQLRLRLPLFSVVAFDTRLTGILAPDSNIRFPQLSTRTDVSAHLHLFDDNLDLIAGTSIQYQSAVYGGNYDPGRRDIYRPYDISAGPRTFLPQWNLYANARFGSSYVRLGLNNILGTEYYSIYRYPQMGRTFLLGVSWALVD